MQLFQATAVFCAIEQNTRFFLPPPQFFRQLQLGEACAMGGQLYSAYPQWTNTNINFFSKYEYAGKDKEEYDGCTQVDVV